MAAKKTVKKKTAGKGFSGNKKAAGLKTLAFDIGGSGLKASILNERGEMVTERARVDTPKPCPPALLLEKLKELTAQLPPFDRVSVGFPGPVRKGKTLSSANLGSDTWNGFDLQRAIVKQTGKPTIVINDADMQGLGAIKGEGVEMVITLGTGVGSALFEEDGSRPTSNWRTFLSVRERLTRSNSAIERSRRSARANGTGDWPKPWRSSGH
jgi:hypothetical protein